jgi:hypothetical protein
VRPWPNSSPCQAWRCPRWPSRQWIPTCARASRARFRADASCSRDARDCSSSA